MPRCGVSRLLRLFAVAFVLALPAAPLVAQTYNDAPAGQKIGQPIYDPVAKRYFELMRADPRPFHDVWDLVAEQARSLSFEGVQGRLAIVDSPEIHEFLLNTFHPGHYQYVWIGLRYLCRAKELVWSDGRPWKPGSFQIWDAKWNQDVYTCGDKNDPNDWAPIAYSPEMKSWIAKGRHKGYDWYFVEFPTGKP